MDDHPFIRGWSFVNLWKCEIAVHFMKSYNDVNICLKKSGGIYIWIL